MDIPGLRNFLEIPYDELEDRNLAAKEARASRIPPEQAAERRRKELTDEKRLKAITVCFTDLEGRWMGQAPEIDGKVYIDRGEAPPGQIVPVLVEQAGDYDLVGGIAGADGPAVALAPSRAQLVGAPLAVEQTAARMPRPRFPILSH